MQELIQPLPFSVLFTLASAKAKSVIVNYYRQCLSDIITITTNSGPVKGYKTPSSCDHYQYINFLGIPYAKPPIGELRFKVCSFFTPLKSCFEIFPRLHQCAMNKTTPNNS